MKRTIYLTAYDVFEKRRLQRTRKFLVGYKAAGQKSCFECWLTQGELHHVMNRLAQIMDTKIDRLHLFQLDPRMKVRCFGVAKSFDAHGFMIV